MKKFVSLIVIATVCTALFATGAKDTKAAGGNVTIKHWYWADNSAYSAKMQEMVADFNATNGKGITVVAEEYPWDGGGYSQNLFNAAMGGGGPDTASWKLTATPMFTANKLLANLDGFINSWTDKGLIENSLYDVMRQAGGTNNIYVMPWNTQVLYVYYRPSMFRAVGISVPKTYDEFLTAVEKLTRDTNGDGRTDVYGFGMRGSNGGQEPWGSFIYARGGNFNNLTSPQAIQGMNDYINIYKKGWAPPSAPADGFAQVIAAFKSGITAMTIHHTGSAVEMEQTFGDDVSAFPFPKGVGQWTSMGDTENVMFEACKDKEAAFAWLAYLATGKGQETWCTTTFNVPVSSKVKALSQFQNNRFMKASIDGSSFAGIIPILPTTTEWISPIWPNTIGAALTGNQSAAETMQILQNALHGN
jgi:multiple sugar transport system substrate-binding protein